MFVFHSWSINDQLFIVLSSSIGYCDDEISEMLCEFGSRHFNISIFVEKMYAFLSECFIEMLWVYETFVVNLLLPTWQTHSLRLLLQWFEEVSFFMAVFFPTSCHLCYGLHIELVVFWGIYNFVSVSFSRPDALDALPRLRRRKSETFRAQYIDAKEIK